MMLPSSTYAKTSALCRCAGTTSPGEKTTVSTKPSFPGISGRCFVIRGVSFAIWPWVLEDATNRKSASGRTNNRNIRVMLMYRLLAKFHGSQAAAVQVCPSKSSAWLRRHPFGGPTGSTLTLKERELLRARARKRSRVEPFVLSRGIKAHGWYPPCCHWTNNASWVAVQYGPPGGMEGGSPLCGETFARTRLASLGFDI